MADARMFRTLAVAVVVLLLLVCYLLTRFQNQGEIARAEAEVSRLEKEKDSTQAFVAANIAVQEILQLTRVDMEAEAAVLRDYVDLLEQQRQQSALTVRRIRKTSDLQIRLDSTFPEMVCPLRGKDLRDELQEFGWLRTNATFYELTNRLEELGYLKGFYDARMVGDFAVRERHYEITVAGLRAYHAAHAFYTNGVVAPMGS